MKFCEFKVLEFGVKMQKSSLKSDSQCKNIFYTLNDKKQRLAAVFVFFLEKHLGAFFVFFYDLRQEIG